MTRGSVGWLTRRGAGHSLQKDGVSGGDTRAGQRRPRIAWIWMARIAGARRPWQATRIKTGPVAVLCGGDGGRYWLPRCRCHLARRSQDSPGQLMSVTTCFASGPGCDEADERSEDEGMDSRPGLIAKDWMRPWTLTVGAPFQWPPSLSILCPRPWSLATHRHTDRTDPCKALASTCERQPHIWPQSFHGPVERRSTVHSVAEATRPRHYWRTRAGVLRILPIALGHPLLAFLRLCLAVLRRPSSSPNSPILAFSPTADSFRRPRPSVATRKSLTAQLLATRLGRLRLSALTMVS